MALLTNDTSWDSSHDIVAFECGNGGQMISPLVSVLMPVYKGERFIARSIDSVLAQTYQEVELIIVNDGSPDNCATVIRPYLTDRRVKYLEQANAGVAMARNAALRLASGTYIGLCDQDDEWLPDKAAKQVAYLEMHPEVALVHGDVDYIDESGGSLSHDPYFPAPVRGICFTRLFVGNPIMAVAAMFRRRVVDAIGGFDPAIKYADDYDLWLRIAAEHPIGYLNESVARYRLHAENNSHHQVAIREATLRVLRKAEHELPAACKQVPQADRRLRYFHLYNEIARYARTEGNSLASWNYWLRAAAVHPRRAFEGLVPQAFKNRVRWYRSRLKG